MIQMLSSMKMKIVMSKFCPQKNCTYRPVLLQYKKRYEVKAKVYRHSVKGQSMLFALLGIAVLALVIIFGFLYFEEVEEFFISLTQGQDAVELLEAQGGYTKPRESLSFGDISLGYMSQEGVQVRKIEDVEEDIAQYTEEALAECFEDGFEGYTVEQNKAVVAVHFEEEHMLVRTDWELRFVDEEGERAFDINEINAKITSSFKALFTEAERFLREAPYVDSSQHYYEVYNVSLSVMQAGNESIVSFSQGEEYFITAFG